MTSEERDSIDKKYGLKRRNWKKRNMTSKERAENFLLYIRSNSGTMWTTEFVIALEEAFNTAIEEERKANGKIAEDESKRAWRLYEEEDDSDRDRTFHTLGAARMAELIARLILKIPTDLRGRKET